MGAGTASGDGAVNSGIEAFTGLGSAVAMSNIMTGEVIFGGPGSGLFGVLLLVVLAVFIAGLMVGRTPEYLGKKLGAREVKLAALRTLRTDTPTFVVLPIGFIIIFALLNFLAALFIGPLDQALTTRLYP